MVAFFLIILPLLTGLIAFFLKEEKVVKSFAFLSSLATLAVSILGLTLMKAEENLQFTAQWMQPIGSSFSLRLDGMGQLLCLLTAISYPLVFLGSWNASYKRPNNFFALMLLAQAGLMGVFLATDALVFYFFWELALIPMYFLSSQWGGERRIPVTFKFFIYTFVGSVLMLIGILYIQSKTVSHSFSLNAFYVVELSSKAQSWLFWLLGQQSIRYLKEDTEGNIWFIHEKNLGVVDMSAQQPAIIHLPELNNKMLSGFEFIYPVNDNNIFIGGERGFFHINYEKYKKNIPALQVQVRAVKIVNKKDSLLFGGYFANVDDKQIQGKNQIPRIRNNWKTILFEFSSPLFGQQANLEYTYKLKGFDENWAEWSGKTEKEYTHLAPGTYTFEIKVRNNLGNESEPVGYTFKVLPPWYQTTLAYIIYLLLFGLAVYYLYKWQRKKFNQQQEKYEEEQKRLQYLYQLEINKAENELVALRNEKLQSEIDFKNSELATTAMHLVQKGELLAKIKGELNQIMKVLDNEKAVIELKKMIKVLSEDDKMDKDWEHFAQHFDKVNSDFVVSLKEKHPTITGNELKLCAYLRMNLSTKEIAQLMNISVRGVEISRYRLRKKLQIPSEKSLFDYLINIQTKP